MILPLHELFPPKVISIWVRIRNCQVFQIKSGRCSVRSLETASQHDVALLEIDRPTEFCLPCVLFHSVCAFTSKIDFCIQNIWNSFGSRAAILAFRPQSRPFVSTAVSWCGWHAFHCSPVHQGSPSYPVLILFIY